MILAHPPSSSSPQAAGPMDTAAWNPSAEASGERRASPVDESGGPRNLLDSVFKAANGKQRKYGIYIHTVDE